MECGPSGRLVHGQMLAAALIVIMSQHRSADTRQSGVAAQEVAGESVNEVQQMAEGIAVNVHRRVLGVDANAMLVEVAVWRELPEPWFAAQRDRHCAQRTLVTARETFVLMAYRAGRVATRHAIAGCSLLHVLEFRLGEIDGHGDAMRIKARIFVEYGFLDVVVGHAVVVEPAHGLHTIVGLFNGHEPILYSGRAGGQQTHHHIGVSRPFFRLE